MVTPCARLAPLHLATGLNREHKYGYLVLAFWRRDYCRADSVSTKLFTVPAVARVTKTVQIINFFEVQNGGWL